MKLTVAAAQLALRDGDEPANLAAARLACEEAAARKADLLVLPELWLSGYDLEHASELALAPGDSRWDAIATLARDHDLAVAGSLLVREGDGVRNALVIFDRSGLLVARYDKLHLFPPGGEVQHLAPGQAIQVASLGPGSSRAGAVEGLGLAICYDLRFPELFRAMRGRGATLVLLPAQWPHSRLAHWSLLVRARAVENQVFLVAANRTGRDGAIRYAGHSVILDPWGEPMVEVGDPPAVLSATLDLDAVAQVRARFPVWGDRRADLFGEGRGGLG